SARSTVVTSAPPAPATAGRLPATGTTTTRTSKSREAALTNRETRIASPFPVGAGAMGVRNSRGGRGPVDVVVGPPLGESCPRRVCATITAPIARRGGAVADEAGRDDGVDH